MMVGLTSIFELLNAIVNRNHRLRPHNRLGLQGHRPPRRGPLARTTHNGHPVGVRRLLPQRTLVRPAQVGRHRPVSAPPGPEPYTLLGPLDYGSSCTVCAARCRRPTLWQVSAASLRYRSVGRWTLLGNKHMGTLLSLYGMYDS